LHTSLGHTWRMVLLKRDTAGWGGIVPCSWWNSRIERNGARARLSSTLADAIGLSGVAVAGFTNSRPLQSRSRQRRGGWERFGVRWLGVLLLVVLAGAGAARGQDTHGREYLAQHPSESLTTCRTGRRRFALAKELDGYLKSSDSELRDGFAYSILSEWIFA